MYNPKLQKGFSLVETLIAITVLLVAVLVPMRITSQSIKTAAFSREQLVAVSLAQEGIESMIKLRDNDALDGGATWSWYAALPNSCKSSDGCSYDVSNDTFVSCQNLNDCRLYFDPEAGDGQYYTHESGGNEVSMFARKVEVESITASEARITATIYWDSKVLGGDEVSIVTRTEIFDQYAP